MVGTPGSRTRPGLYYNRPPGSKASARFLVLEPVGRPRLKPRASLRARGVLAGMHLTDALPAYLKQKQTLVEEALRRALVLGDDCPATLAEAMAYSLLGGGK